MKMFSQKLVCKISSLITGLLFYFILCSPLLAVTFDRVVAKVNEDVITLGNLKNSVASFLQQNGNSNSLSQSLENKKVMKQVLEELVAQKLQVHEAKKNGMVVTEETIENALADIYKNNNISSEQFEIMLKNEGSDLESYKEIIRDQILVSRIAARQIATTSDIKESSIKKYYKKNKKNFWIPEKIEISHIMLIKEGSSSSKEIKLLKIKAEEILKKIKDGENFSELAKKHSTDVSAHSGGSLGVVNRGTMMPEFEKAAFDLKLGEVSGVVETINGFHVIKCDNVVPGYIKKYKIVRPEIKKILNAKKREKYYKKWISELKKKSFVEISLFEDLKPIKKVRSPSFKERSQAGSSVTLKPKRHLKNKKKSIESEALVKELLIEEKLRRYKKLYLNGKITKETFSKKKRELLENL